MLSRALAIVLAAGLAVVLLLAGGQQVALAGGPGNNGFYGNVTCDQSYSPQCQVTAGSSPSAGTPASPGTQAGGQPPAGTTAGGGTAGGCSGTMNATWGCIPAGCQVTVQTLACPIGAAAPAPGGGPAPPDPAVLAALAVGHDHLGRHLAGGRRGGRGTAAVVHDRRGGVPGGGVPGAEHQRRDLTPAGRQRGLPGKGRNRVCGPGPRRTGGPPGRIAHERRR